MISDSEMAVFNTAILDAAFDPNDFNPVAVEDDRQGAEPHAITGVVTVHRLSSGEYNTYRAGFGSTWLADFAADLVAGRFGKP